MKKPTLRCLLLGHKRPNGSVLGRLHGSVMIVEVDCERCGCELQRTVYAYSGGQVRALGMPGRFFQEAQP